MPDLTGRRIAIIASGHVEEAELVGPRDRLREAGATVEVFSLDGEPLQAVESDVNPTSMIEVDGDIDAVDVDGIHALIVPGGTVNADNLRTDQRAQTLVRKAAGAGAVVGVICHGPWLLVSAGLVEGLRLTSWPSLEVDIRNAGGDWVDAEVVVDRFLITSRNPDDVPAFSDAIAQAVAGLPA